MSLEWQEDSVRVTSAAPGSFLCLKEGDRIRGTADLQEVEPGQKSSGTLGHWGPASPSLLLPVPSASWWPTGEQHPPPDPAILFLPLYCQTWTRALGL